MWGRSGVALGFSASPRMMPLVANIDGLTRA